MKAFVRIIVVLTLVCTLALVVMPDAIIGGTASGIALATSPAAANAEPGTILVRFQPTVSSSGTQVVLKGISAAIQETIPQINVYRVSVPAGTEEQALAALQRNRSVKYAERNTQVWAIKVPNDPSFPLQWHLPKISAPDAWEVTTGSDRVVIAIVDTGIDLDHPDLAAKIVPGYDFVNGDNDPQDDNGHGTHVAGIAAAATDNGIGVAGVCWQCRLMPVKVLDDSGSGYSSDVAAGIIYAAKSGARIINLSLGGEYPSQTMRDAVYYAHSLGALIVAAAGNCGDPQTYWQNGCSRQNADMFPAAFEHVVGVGATDQNDQRASFSTYAWFVDVTAPGVDIYSTMWDDTYAWLSGTSMATPHVAGLAGLIWSVGSTLTNDQVEQIIESTADDLGAPGRDEYYGWGRINAARAVRGIPRLRPPNLISPADGAQFTEGQRISLYWSATGKEYKGEVWRGLSRILSFGWQSPTSRNIGLLEPGRSYSWRVQTRNKSTLSDWSVTWNFTVNLAPPSDLRFEITSGNNILLRWRDNSSYEDGYYIYRSGERIASVGRNVTSVEVGVGVQPVPVYSVTAFRGTAESAPSTPPICPDFYEVDNSLLLARPIQVNSPQRHNFHAPGDIDWVSFQASAGTTYAISTILLGPLQGWLNDTIVELYNQEGRIIQSDDDVGGGRGSSIVWTAPASDRYYIKVQEFGNNHGQCIGYAYDLSVTTVATRTR